jgi:hypothetical protein
VRFAKEKNEGPVADFRFQSLGTPFLGGWPTSAFKRHLHHRQDPRRLDPQRYRLPRRPQPVLSGVEGSFPLDLWYIVPVDRCTEAPMLRFYPHRKAKKMRLEKFREAWRQLRPKNPSNGPITTYAASTTSTMNSAQNPVLTKGTPGP